MKASIICIPCLKLVLSTASVVLRALEISFALFMLFYLSSRIPAALQHLLNFSLRFLGFFASPAFAFCLCNAIIASVFAKASRSATTDETVRESINGMIEVGDDLQDIWTLSLLLSDAHHEEELCKKVVVHRDEEITSQLTDVTFREEEESESKKGLSAADFNKDSYDEEEERTMSSEMVLMTNDELKRRAEDFIAKELRFRREESLAIVHPSY